MNKRYWKINNREEAERQSFYRTLGYLEALTFEREEVRISTLVQYMEKIVTETTEELNRKYPEYE